MSVLEVRKISNQKLRQAKREASETTEIMKSEVEISETENRKAIENTSRAKCWLFEKSTKLINIKLAVLATFLSSLFYHHTFLPDT